MRSAYLQHHGILGQKWGVRRYENEDGTLTEEGKKRYQKGMYKELKSKHVKYPGQPLRTSQEFNDTLNRGASKIVSNEQVQNLKSLRQKMVDAAKKSTDFYDTEAFDKANKRAYQETYNWFKKNEPDFLKSIIEQNGGREDDLDMFHDFRKAYEGYQDVIWSEEEDKWKKTPEGKAAQKSEKEWEKAWRDYQTECSKIASNILGEYGNKKVSAFDDITYRDLVANSIDFDLILKNKD